MIDAAGAGPQQPSMCPQEGNQHRIHDGRPLIVRDMSRAVDSVRRSFPLAEFHAIDGAGHIPHYERPDVVKPMLISFLRTH